MNKLILALLIATTFSCNVSKIFHKNKTTEVNKTQTEVKVDSVAEVETEKEIVSTFTNDTKTEFFDLSEVTIYEVMNDSGVVKERTTTTKTNVKTNKVDKGTENILVAIKEQNKVKKNTLFEQESKNKTVDVKKDRKVEKTSLPNWLWIILIITGVVFALVLFWKVKKNNFTQFFK
jgi:DNA-binding XRE family transcriptional regulator